jgi:hypothetical protein
MEVCNKTIFVVQIVKTKIANEGLTNYIVENLFVIVGVYENLADFVKLFLGFYHTYYMVLKFLYLYTNCLTFFSPSLLNFVILINSLPATQFSKNFIKC